MIIFDIETAALPDEQLFSIVPPFIEPPHPGEFDLSQVKYGNAKDPALRKAKEDEARTKHEAAVRTYLADVAAARVGWAQSIRDKAALDPTTGMVLAVGYLGINETTGERKTKIDHGAEDVMLGNFWSQWRKCLASGRRMVGHNITGFDFPFLVRRSWILDVPVPAEVLDRNKARSVALDTQDHWLCGQRWGSCESNLNHIARVLGVGEKNGNGADFAKLWRSEVEADRQAAIDYLVNDLALVASVAQRMGVLV